VLAKGSNKYCLTSSLSSRNETKIQEKTMLQNQSKLQEFDLVKELNEQAAEKISGGYEVFTIKNQTKYNINYLVDGTKTKSQFAKPGTSSVWTAYKGGIIDFDIDGRSNYRKSKKYNLANGGVYAFRDNKATKGNLYDIELYRIS